MLLTSFAGLLQAVPAMAEASPAMPQCRVDVAPLSSPRTIPSNIPALVVMDVSSPGYQASVSVKGAYTIEPDSRLPGVTLIVPTAPLAEGAFVLETKISCSDGSSKDETRPGPKVGPAVPLPTTLGVFGGVTTPDPFGAVRYPLVLTPEASAHLGTTSFELSVDGTVWGRQSYGVAGLATSGSTLALSIENGAVYLGGTNLGGKRICAGESGTEKHALEVRAHVAGASVDPAPLMLDVDVDCKVSPIPPPPPYQNDAGGDDRATGGGGGCSASGGGDLGRVGLVFIAGAVVASALLRRRQRPRRD